jgi:general secretion pathway protein A
MYNHFFGLQEDPFRLTPDPKFLFLTWKQRQILAGLTYALMSRKRCVVLTGEIGMGKTTLITAALGWLPRERIQFSVLYNPMLTPDEMLEATLLGFGVAEVPASKPQRLLLLERLVEEAKTKGRVSAVVIDEAQNLSVEGLEAVRIMGNLDSLQIALVGQTELNKLINRRELQALKQRVALRLNVEPLTADETQQYISNRWTKAGGTLPIPFDAEAMGAVMRYSGGCPRLISTICDNTLMLAFSDTAPVSATYVEEAAQRLSLSEIPQVPELPESPDTDAPELVPARAGLPH